MQEEVIVIFKIANTKKSVIPVIRVFLYAMQ